MTMKVERVPLHAVRDGATAEFFALLSSREKRTAKNGKPYYDLELCDRKRKFVARVWSDSVCFEACDRLWEAGMHLLVHARHDPKWDQLVVLEARPAVEADRAEGYDPTAFDLGTRFDVEELFTELLGFADRIRDEPLRKLVQSLLWKHETALKKHPAAARNHHAYRGGLLEHLVSVCRNGQFFADRYVDYYPDLQPPINRDLVLAGCILHDIGKLDELDMSRDGIRYTVSGNLLGHIIVGRDMIRDAAREIAGLNPELLLLLEHVVLAHQGTKEWDSPKEPALPEALLVHFADDLDAKMNMFVSILQQPGGDDPFTDMNNIFRRRFLRGRSV